MKDEKIIFEKNNNTASPYMFSPNSGAEEYIPGNLLRDDLDDQAVCAESEVVRHFISLSGYNYGVDNGLYPLGSCTMKYNPKINEKIAANPAFSLHPLSDSSRVQGNLEIIYRLSESLKEITGMDDLDLSPCAGAHGELTGLYIIDAYFKRKKEKRPYILIPDSAHGTNPASASMAGFKVITVKSDAEGHVDLEDLKSKAGPEIAAFMLTNPNTVGIFEGQIEEIVKTCHDLDIQLYYDGANLNAILGIVRPGDMGFDVVHLNLHKTFSTPHGGGGPGAGPVGVKAHLADFLPGYQVFKKDDTFSLETRGEGSIGKVRSFYANFSVIIKSLVYIVALGSEGLTKTGFIALLNAGYLAALLKDDFDIVSPEGTMHEFVISLTALCKEQNLTIMDFAKRILDYGYHAPTVSFPLIVHDCLMIEPTETERKETLDKFAGVLKNIKAEAEKTPQLLKDAPVKTPIRRVDEVTAARNPLVQYPADNEEV